MDEPNWQLRTAENIRLFRLKALKAVRRLRAGFERYRGHTHTQLRVFNTAAELARQAYARRLDDGFDLWFGDPAADDVDADAHFRSYLPDVWAIDRAKLMQALAVDAVETSDRLNCSDRDFDDVYLPSEQQIIAAKRESLKKHLTLLDQQYIRTPTQRRYRSSQATLVAAGFTQIRIMSLQHYDAETFEPLYWSTTEKAWVPRDRGTIIDRDNLCVHTANLLGEWEAVPYVPPTDHDK